MQGLGLDDTAVVEFEDDVVKVTAEDARLTKVRAAWSTRQNMDDPATEWPCSPRIVATAGGGA